MNYNDKIDTNSSWDNFVHAIIWYSIRFVDFLKFIQILYKSLNEILSVL